MSADTSILPAELTVIPVPLIGVAGLDISNNPVHKTIWEAFTYNRKNDRSQIQFKLLPPNYEFPVSKPKRTSYEWYHPKGILKKNWMLKHLHVLPAVVVLFQDIEWNDPLWSEKQLHCAAQMQTIKNSLQVRCVRCIIFWFSLNSIFFFVGSKHQIGHCPIANWVTVADWRKFVGNRTECPFSQRL